jgi:hypothetical protein
MSLLSYYLTTIGGYTGRLTDSSLINVDSIENYASNNYAIIVCIRCRWNVFTEPLPSTELGDALDRAVALQL